MAIDVEAVCAEWRRLGGFVLAPDGKVILAAPGHYDPHAAWVSETHISAYFDPGASGSARLTDASRLPELARAWGLTKEPGVLTWDEAAALWVEWGGESAVSTSDGQNPHLHLGFGMPGVVVDRRRLEPEEGIVFCYRIGDAEVKNITLTADALEEMAEACGLPRTPAMVEQLGRSLMRGLARDDAARASGGPADENFKEMLSMGKGAADDLFRALSKPESKAVDQWAEQHSEYNARLDAFIGSSS